MTENYGNYKTAWKREFPSKIDEKKPKPVAFSKMAVILIIFLSGYFLKRNARYHVVTSLRTCNYFLCTIHENQSKSFL